MPELLADPPLGGRTVTHGAAQLTALPWTPLIWLAPFPGHETAFSDALGAAHGCAFPGSGEVTKAGGVEMRWAGRAQALLVGVAEPDASLGEHGAVTDVSDVYVGLRLDGPARTDVLARIVPLDLRGDRFGVSRAARTLLGHMNVHLTVEAEAIEVLVMRSFAAFAFHEIEEAMEGVAARADLAR